MFRPDADLCPLFQGKHVEGNQEGITNVKKMRTWRQYMNRRGGFNRFVHLCSVKVDLELMTCVGLWTKSSSFTGSLGHPSLSISHSLLYQFLAVEWNSYFASVGSTTCDKAGFSSNVVSGVWICVQGSRKTNCGEYLPNSYARPLEILINTE